MEGFEHTEKFNIAYLNPFVLQKQMENLFDDYKFDCIIDYNFSQNHSILFWNLIWYFNKTNFPNHLPNAILRSSFIIQNFVKNYKGSTKETENDFLINIDVYLDHFNEFNQLKLYHYHKYDKIINSNIFENFFLSKKHIVFIMWHIERNVLIQPILLLMKKRLILSQNKILASSLTNFDKMYRESFKFIRQETRKNRKKFKKNVPYDYIGKFHVSDLPPTKSCSYCDDKIKDDCDKNPMCTMNSQNKCISVVCMMEKDNCVPANSCMKMDGKCMMNFNAMCKKVKFEIMCNMMDHMCMWNDNACIAKEKSKGSCGM
ncbi:hypothetical protein A3Q56_07138 [Intoshia linei]|uniref:Uncharacterized protein n=1 Tax=Intoshia linei TaxID=1819745 RepID=A0A177AT20_9BILA|nr:hypothetical protein A3Q56_07138 [Intoshia linei]